MRKKSKRLKSFKGCLKMPLNTNLSFEELVSRCTYTGNWLTERKQILSAKAKRQWYINVYITKTTGEKSLECITSPNKVDKVALNGLIDIALQDAQKEPDVDYDKSYLTVSC